MTSVIINHVDAVTIENAHMGDRNVCLGFKNKEFLWDDRDARTDRVYFYSLSQDVFDKLISAFGQPVDGYQDAPVTAPTDPVDPPPATPARVPDEPDAPADEALSAAA